MHVFLFNFLVSYNLIGRSEAVSLESKMKIEVHYCSPYRNIMLKHSPDSDYVSTASVYSVVASIFVANITMEPKASRMMSFCPYSHSAEPVPQPNALMVDGPGPGG